MRWKIAVSALALAGVAMIGAVFALRGGVPGLKKDAPFIAAAQGPTKVAPPSDQTVTTSSDAGATLLHDTGKPGPVKVVNSEEQPVDLNAQASVNNPPPASAPLRRGTTDPALAAIINTPLVAPPAAAPPKGMTSEFPDPKPVRTISLRPDGTPIGAVSPPDQPASDANAAPAPAEQPSKPAVAPSAPQPSNPRRRRQARRRASRSRRRPRSNCRPSFHRPSRLRAWWSAKPIRPRPTGRRRPAWRSAKQRSGETGQGRQEAEGRAGRRRDRDDWRDRAACRRDGRDDLGRMVGSARRAEIRSGGQEHGDKADQQIRRRTQRLRHRRA